MSKEKITLRKPLLINGEYRKELTYDIDELDINRLTKAEGLKAKIGGQDTVGTISIAQTDYALHVCIGMHAIMAINPDIDVEDLQRIKGFDLTKLASIGQRFFIEPVELEQATLDELQEDMPNTIIAP